MTEQEKEKVLHGLASCGFCNGANICEVTECPYRDNKGWCVHELTHDAGMLISELMKENEAVKPETIMYTGAGIGISNCPRCGNKIDEYHNERFCGSCGQAVKWR